jgi:hypothetical protein
MKPFQTRITRVRCVEDAKTLLISALAEGNREGLVRGDYPFDLDLAGLLFPLKNRGLRPDEDETGALTVEELGPIFADAAWELCLEGILRPGSRSPMDKTTHESSGYTLTSRGRKQLGARARAVSTAAAYVD